MTEPTTDKDDAPRESIADLCGELIEDAKQLGRAELVRMQAIVFRGIVTVRMAVVFAVASALLAQSGFEPPVPFFSSLFWGAWLARRSSRDLSRD